MSTVIVFRQAQQPGSRSKLFQIGFLKMNGKTEPFIILTNAATDKNYVSVDENNEFVLTDDISKARKFNKYTCEGLDLYEFIFNQFPGVKSIRFIYERDLVKIA